MTIPSESTWEIVGAPRRPSIDDLGGAAFVDDQKFPPDPETMPSALMENQNEKQVAALARVVPSLVLSIRFSGGTPSVDQFSACSGLVSSGTFTVTDVGTGITKIEWPANTFPTPIAKPKGGVTGATVGQCAVEAITNGMTIRTTNAAGAAADLPATADYY